MRYMTIIFALALATFIACQPATAQLPSPTVTKKYSNEEIDRMIQTYKTSRSKDTYPSTILQQQFAKDFPKAKDVDWETVGNIFEVEFEIGRTDYKAYYDETGNLLMYSLDLRNKDLPAIVRNAALDKYPNSKIDDVKKIVKGTEIFYKVELEKNNVDVKATFNPNGTFIKEIFD